MNRVLALALCSLIVLSVGCGESEIERKKREALDKMENGTTAEGQEGYNYLKSLGY